MREAGLLSKGRFRPVRLQPADSHTDFMSEKPVDSPCHLWQGPYQVSYMPAIFLAYWSSMSHGVLTTFQDVKDIFFFFLDGDCDPIQLSRSMAGGSSTLSQEIRLSGGKRESYTLQT